MQEKSKQKKQNRNMLRILPAGFCVVLAVAVYLLWYFSPKSWSAVKSCGLYISAGLFLLSPLFIIIMFHSSSPDRSGGEQEFSGTCASEEKGIMRDNDADYNMTTLGLKTVDSNKTVELSNIGHSGRNIEVRITQDIGFCGSDEIIR